MDIKKNIEEFRELLGRMEKHSGEIEAIAALACGCLKNGGKILTCGNGGSAADALHMSEELVGRFCRNRRSLPGISLCADVTALTCILNDYGAEHIFSRQIESLGNEGDMLFAFTTSGNSQNIANALKAAKAAGVKTVLLSGKDGGICRDACDLKIIVESDNTARIQEFHTLILHSILELIDDAFCEG